MAQDDIMISKNKERIVNATYTESDYKNFLEIFGVLEMENDFLSALVERNFCRNKKKCKRTEHCVYCWLERIEKQFNIKNKRRLWERDNTSSVSYITEGWDEKLAKDDEVKNENKI